MLELRLSNREAACPSSLHKRALMRPADHRSHGGEQGNGSDAEKEELFLTPDRSANERRVDAHVMDHPNKHNNVPNRKANRS